MTVVQSLLKSIQCACATEVLWTKHIGGCFTEAIVTIFHMVTTVSSARFICIYLSLNLKLKTAQFK